MLDRIDDGKIFDITLLDCVMELDKAWHEVSLGIISKCLKKVGMWKDEEVRKDWEGDDDIPLSDLELCKFKELVNL
jgi:hypothetical protein